jgi:hypothetical protein
MKMYAPQPNGVATGKTLSDLQGEDRGRGSGSDQGRAGGLGFMGQYPARLGLEQRRDPPGPGRAQKYGQFSCTDQGRAVSASEDRTLRVWDLYNWREIDCLSVEDSVGAIALAQDNRNLVVGDVGVNVYYLSLCEPT